MTQNTFTTHQVALRCQVSINTVVNWIKDGSLAAHKTKGGHRRIRKEDFLTFLKENNMPISLRKIVLIIEDDPSIRMGLNDLLSNNNFDVETAENGFLGGMLIEKLRPDLVILDIIMPDLDGFWVCNFIKKHEYLKNTKIIILTGFPSPENLKKAKEYGANKILSKPTDNKMIIKSVNELLVP